MFSHYSLYFFPEPGDIGLWVLNALLALAAAALIAHVVGSYWQRIAPRIAPRSNTRETGKHGSHLNVIVQIVI